MQPLARIERSCALVSFFLAPRRVVAMKSPEMSLSSSSSMSLSGLRLRRLGTGLARDCAGEDFANIDIPGAFFAGIFL
jgi:hypothetical protein